jgi:di/tricarboxylate transporter
LGGGFCLGGAVQESGALDLCAQSLNEALADAKPQASVSVFNLVIAAVRRAARALAPGALMPPALL